MEQEITGIILFVIGGLCVVRPDLYLRFQAWMQKAVMGADYAPSSRTHSIMRVFGVIMVILGLLSLVGRI